MKIKKKIVKCHAHNHNVTIFTVREKTQINCFILPLAAFRQMTINSYTLYAMDAYLYSASLVYFYYASVVYAQSSPKN